MHVSDQNTATAHDFGEKRTEDASEQEILIENCMPATVGMETMRDRVKNHSSAPAQASSLGQSEMQILEENGAPSVSKTPRDKVKEDDYFPEQEPIKAKTTGVGEDIRARAIPAEIEKPSEQMAGLWWRASR